MHCTVVLLLLLAFTHCHLSHATSAACSRRIDRFLIQKGVSLRAASATAAAAAASGSALNVCGNVNNCCNAAQQQKLVELGRREIKAFLRSKILDTQGKLNSLIAFAGRSLLNQLDNASSVFDKRLEDIYGDTYLKYKGPIVRPFFTKIRQHIQGKPVSLDATVDILFKEVKEVVLRMQLENYELTQDYVKCFMNFMKKYSTVQSYPTTLKSKLIPSLSAMRQLSLGLNALNQALLTVMKQNFTASCLRAITRQQFCWRCAAAAQQQPCYSMCANTLTGCLAQLAPLAEPFDSVLRATTKVAQIMADRPLLSELHGSAMLVSAAVMDMQEMQSKVYEARPTCGMPPLKTSAAAHAAAAAAAGRPRAKRAAQTNDRFGWEYSPETAAASAPSSAAAAAVASASRSMAELARSVKVQLDQQVGLFSWERLLQQRCTGSTANCWNGTAVGAYMHRRVGTGTVAQLRNPEVSVDSRMQPDVARMAAVLLRLERRMQRAMDRNFKRENDSSLTVAQLSLLGEGTPFVAGAAASVADSLGAERVFNRIAGMASGSAAPPPPFAPARPFPAGPLLSGDTPPPPLPPTTSPTAPRFTMPARGGGAGAEGGRGSGDDEARLQPTQQTSGSEIWLPEATTTAAAAAAAPSTAPPPTTSADGLPPTPPDVDVEDTDAPAGSGGVAVSTAASLLSSPASTTRAAELLLPTTSFSDSTAASTRLPTTTTTTTTTTTPSTSTSTTTSTTTTTMPMTTTTTAAVDQEVAGSGDAQEKQPEPEASGDERPPLPLPTPTELPPIPPVVVDTDDVSSGDGMEPEVGKPAVPQPELRPIPLSTEEPATIGGEVDDDSLWMPTNERDSGGAEGNRGEGSVHHPQPMGLKRRGCGLVDSATCAAAADRGVGAAAAAAVFISLVMAALLP